MAGGGGSSKWSAGAWAAGELAPAQPSPRPEPDRMAAGQICPRRRRLSRGSQGEWGHFREVRRRQSDGPLRSGAARASGMFARETPPSPALSTSFSQCRRRRRRINLPPPAGSNNSRREWPSRRLGSARFGLARLQLPADDQRPSCRAARQVRELRFGANFSAPRRTSNVSI